MHIFIRTNVLTDKSMTYDVVLQKERGDNRHEVVIPAYSDAAAELMRDAIMTAVEIYSVEEISTP